jgi:hypothetical protein
MMKASDVNYESFVKQTAEVVAQIHQAPPLPTASLQLTESLPELPPNIHDFMKGYEVFCTQGQILQDHIFDQYDAGNGLIRSAKIQSASTNTHFQIQREEIEALLPFFKVQIARTFSILASSQMLSKEEIQSVQRVALSFLPRPETGEVYRLAIETTGQVGERLIGRHS